MLVTTKYFQSSQKNVIKAQAYKAQAYKLHSKNKHINIRKDWKWLDLASILAYSIEEPERAIKSFRALATGIPIIDLNSKGQYNKTLHPCNLAIM